MMKKIVGITIGPIIETISESKKISEIANSSLFFSNIIYEFLVKAEGKYNIITPSFKHIENKGERFYPDRVVLEAAEEKSDEEILNEVKEIYTEILKEENIEDLKGYVNFNIVVMKMEENEIKNIFKNLDGAELIKNFPISYKERVISKKIESYFEDEIKLKKDFNVNYSISSRKSEKKNDNSQEGYRAVLALDIDNMGKFSQNSITEIKDISKAIYEYIESLNKFLKKDKQGLVLYSAGDDILAVLNPKNIFEFIETACEELNSKFSKFNNKDLSVSLGIFICYAKYPIKEAINAAHSLLFGEAKSKKNSAALLFQKHSGQSFKIVINDLINKAKEGNSFNDKNEIFIKLKDIVNKAVNSKEKEIKLLNTIIQKVSLNSFILKEIISDEKRIGYYLENLFEEPKETQPILKDLYELLVLIGKEDKELFEENLEDVLSFFKIVKFYAGRE